jgi:hypothetical protein
MLKAVAFNHPSFAKAHLPGQRPAAAMDPTALAETIAVPARIMAALGNG